MNIPAEWYRKIKEDVVITARKQNICRKLINVEGPLGLGVQEYSYDTLQEMSDAVLNYIFTNTARDVVNFKRSSVKIPILEKTFIIHRRDLASAQKFGMPLNTVSARAAAYKVTNLENELVIVGSGDINGLYNAANNVEATTLDFGTYGNALKKIRAAMALLMADNVYPPYNLVLHPTQWAELHGSIDTTAGGSVDEATRIKQMIGGDIFVTPFITAGTGMLLAAPNQGFFELIVAQDLTVETEIEGKTKNLFGRVFECVVPVVYDSNAICKLTNI